MWVNEVKKWMFKINNNNFINEDYQYSKDAIVYQGTKMELLKSLINTGGFSAEWFGSNGGNMYTNGVYTNYEIGQTIEGCKSNKYGTILVKFRIKNGFKDFLIFDKRMAIKCYGEDYTLKSQLKRYPSLYKMLLNDIGNENINKLSYESEIEHYTSSIAYTIIRCLGGTKQATTVFNSLGIRGLIFYGRNDGPVAIIHNCEDIEVLGYVDASITPLHKGVTIPWKPINFVKKDKNENDIDHIQYFMAQFGNKYLYDKDTRSYNGEVLVKNKNTGLWTFIDVDKKAPLFNIEFYKANVFLSSGKARVKITNDDNWYYIDKKGNLYYRENDTKPFSDLESYTTDFDWDEEDL